MGTVLSAKGRPGPFRRQEGLMDWTLMGSVGWMGRPVGASEEKREAFP